MEGHVGECSHDCTRPATVRIHNAWIVCTLHYLDFLSSERENEASLAVELLKPWRDRAEHHGCVNLVTGLDRLIEDEQQRLDEAQEEGRLWDRISREQKAGADV